MKCPLNLFWIDLISTQFGHILGLQCLLDSSIHLTIELFVHHFYSMEVPTFKVQLHFLWTMQRWILFFDPLSLCYLTGELRPLILKIISEIYVCWLWSLLWCLFSVLCVFSDTLCLTGYISLGCLLQSFNNLQCISLGFTIFKVYIVYFLLYRTCVLFFSLLLFIYSLPPVPYIIPCHCSYMNCSTPF